MVERSQPELLKNPNLQYPTTVHHDLRNADNDDQHNDFLYGNSDSKVDDQVNFVRKVLGIVAAQLTLTFVMCIASAYFAGFGNFMNRVDVGLYCLVGLIVSISMLVCTKACRFAVPWNYLLLLLATVCEAASVAALTAKFEVGAVLTAIFVLCITLVCLFASSFVVRESRRL